MLAALFTGPIISALVNSIFGNITQAFTAYLNKEISEAQLKEQLQAAMLSAFAQVEKDYAASLTQTFQSFMQAAAQSKLMQAVWASVALSQLIVLIWHQIGIPAVSFFLGVRYPSSGATVDWAYALVMFCLGGGAISMRFGPGSNSISSQLKTLTGK
ncbi:hypothetical protein ACQR1W_18125 [Bradyrhizobium sp. HKCCYLS1011]|uniref:hypothetical protein n=1 Tax=Bradyrhizobium sp. HKCCYLS1011 TaxID=3420733 RepID=UPI003EBF05A7